MRKEIEVKFKIARFGPIIERLRRVGAQLEWRGREESFYYDTISQHLKETGRVLGFRREPNGQNVLTLKSIVPTKNHNHSGILQNTRMVDEYAVETEHFKETHRLLRHMGYSAYSSQAHQKQHWSVGGVSVELNITGRKKYIEIKGVPKLVKQTALFLNIHR